MRPGAATAGAAGLASLAAAVLLAAAPAGAQEESALRFECEGENACRVRCAGLPDIGRVRQVVIEEASWGTDTLLLTVTHEFGVATLMLRGDARCRMDNLRAVP